MSCIHTGVEYPFKHLNFAFRGADLGNLVQQASFEAWAESGGDITKAYVTQTHFHTALTKIKPSVLQKVTNFEFEM